MSFEGYYQNICENGHRYDAWTSSYEKPEKCSCGAGPAWGNLVDETNCDLYGIIPESEFEKLLISPQETERCNLGCIRVTKLATYNIPWEGDGIKLQRYWKKSNESGLIPLKEE